MKIIIMGGSGTMGKAIVKEFISKAFPDYRGTNSRGNSEDTQTLELEIEKKS